MPLIKCKYCGRPFYDSEKACPYCGHATNLSAGNRVTKAISDPASHKLMEDILSGNYHPETITMHNTPEATPKPAAEPIAEPVVEDVVEPIVEPEAVVEPEPTEEDIQPSEAVLDRADSIAAAVNANTNNGNDNVDDINPETELETTLPRKKRRWWIWIVIILILLGVAAAVYLKWDFVYSKVSSLLN